MRLHDRESKSCAWDILVEFDEAFKDTLLISHSNALTGITHPDMHMIIVYQVIASTDTALSSELHSVLYQIVNNLVQFITVTLYHQLVHSALERNRHIGSRLIGINHLLEQLVQVDTGHQQTLRTGLNL